MRDKYDDAIDWLRKKDGGKGSYYEEVATLMEELLGRVYELEVESVSATESRWCSSPPRGTPKLHVVATAISSQRRRAPRE